MKNGKQKINEHLSMLGANTAMVNLAAKIPSTKPDEKSLKTLNEASLWFFGETKSGKTVDNVQTPSEGKLVLTEDRYVYKPFRALSQIFLSNRGLDFSRPGVLEAAVGLLQGKTIYANHDFKDIDNWRGVIAESFWDSEGIDSGGVPGINVTTKVDAFLNYRTACGLMMTPPAINAASVTVITEVEFSHLDLVKNGTFWDYFLEEVDGEIVRLIVTKVIEFWEMSFVFMGEDRLAKGLPGAEENPGEDDQQVETKTRQKMSASKLNATEKIMKVDKEQRTLLGITVEGDDVPEQTVLDAALTLAKGSSMTATQIADLSLKATQGEKLMTEKRAEVTRLAKLAELGAEEGTLNEVISKMIGKADVDELASLEKLYRDKIGDKFPAGGQSSLENSDEVETAAGTKKPDENKQAVKQSRLL